MFWVLVSCEAKSYKTHDYTSLPLYTFIFYCFHVLSHVICPMVHAVFAKVPCAIEVTGEATCFRCWTLCLFGHPGEGRGLPCGCWMISVLHSLKRKHWASAIPFLTECMKVSQVNRLFFKHDRPTSCITGIIYVYTKMMCAQTLFILSSQYNI